MYTEPRWLKTVVVSVAEKMHKVWRVRTQSMFQKHARERRQSDCDKSLRLFTTPYKQEITSVCKTWFFLR